MSIEYNDTEEIIEPEVTEVELTEPTEDNYSEMQERMGGDVEPWYSSSVGQVVDVDGNPLTDEDGNTFSSLEEYKKSQTTAKQETTQETQQTPVKKTFADFINQEITPERIKQLSEVGKSFQYNNEFLPKIKDVVPKAGMPKPDNVELDPITKVKSMNKTWHSIAVEPVKKAMSDMYSVLVSEGAATDVANRIVNHVFDPIVSKQRDIIDGLYREEYEKALEQNLYSKFGDKLSNREQEKLELDSERNIDELSKQYFSDEGKDFFYGMINGYLKDPNDKNSFQRGPAAHLFDWISHLVNGGKEYASEKERNETMNNTLKKITADKTQANLLFDTMYYYWIGKNAAKAQEVSFNSGKDAAKKELHKQQKTVRQRPKAAPPQNNDMDGYPEVLRSALLFNQ